MVPVADPQSQRADIRSLRWEKGCRRSPRVPVWIFRFPPIPAVCCSVGILDVLAVGVAESLHCLLPVVRHSLTQPALSEGFVFVEASPSAARDVFVNLANFEDEVAEVPEDGLSADTLAFSWPLPAEGHVSISFSEFEVVAERSGVE